MNESQMNLMTSNFIADDLFKISYVKPIHGMPLWANLMFSKTNNNRAEFSGPGIYAILFRDQLIYVGKFLGKKTNPWSGDIRDTRWDKHLGSMTLRSRNISFSKKSLDRILEGNKSYLLDDIHKSNPQALLRDRGCLSTFNRFSFGSRHWNLFLNFDESHLKLFQFLYVRVSTCTLDTHEIRKLVSEAEDQIVKILNPYCNASIKFPEDPSKHQMYTIETVQHTISDVLSRCYGSTSLESAFSKEDGVTPLHMHLKGEFDENDADKSSYSLFYERLENAPLEALNLVRGICEEFSFAGETEVHFKKRKPPDLRVRDLRVGNKNQSLRIGQNIFTMEWRPTTKMFMCRALISPEQCLNHGISNAKAPRSLTEPLNSEFLFHADGNLNLLIKLIYSSINCREI
jgi:hypothetical protein